MSTRSLKFRLIVWYAGWLTVLFVVFGIFVYRSLDYYLEKGWREALARRTRLVADMIKRSALSAEAIGLEIQNRYAPEENNRFTRVSVQQKVTYTSGAPADASFDVAAVPPPAKLVTGQSFERRALPDGRVLLVATLSTNIGGNSFLIEEGTAAGAIKASLQPWLVALTFGLALLISGAIIGGFLVVQRALRPVDRITRSAERITSRNLAERLPVPDTSDELERLSIALNNMIRRLDDTFQHNQRFLADASHELRTPLTMLQGELEAVIEKTAKSEVREVASSALEEVERLRKIVEGLFALSRLDAGEAMEERELVDLAELVTSTAEQMILLADDKEIAMSCDTQPRVLVEGDRSRLKQVTVNLLDNAIKYTPAGGRVQVRVAANDSKAVVEVSDNGIGIPEEALPRVFERFFRVDKARSRDSGGAGLGLSIVKSICVAHGGAVAVQSKTGQGSRFIVELPLAANGQHAGPKTSGHETG